MAQKERTARIEGIVEQMSERLNSIEGRLNHVESRMDHVESRLTQILYAMIGMWVTTILTILFK